MAKELVIATSDSDAVSVRDRERRRKREQDTVNFRILLKEHTCVFSFSHT